MTTFNTGNLVPSTDGRDLSDNAETIDEFVEGSTQTTITRTGKNVLTRLGLEAQYVFTAINNGVWAAGQSFTAVNQFMVFSGTAFKPKNSTTLPYVVGATPVGDPNVEVVANLSTAQGDARYIREFDDLAGPITASDLADGQSIRFKERSTGNGGGGIGDVVLLSSVTIPAGAPDFGDKVACTGVPTLAIVIRIDPLNNDIPKLGAIGGNVTIDSGALNAAMALTQLVKIPLPKSGNPYIFSNIQLPRGVHLLGDQQYNGTSTTAAGHFIGDGTNPVFLVGDGGATVLREHTIQNLNGDGNTQTVVKGRTAPNYNQHGCFFTTTSATNPTIDLVLCARSHIHNTNRTSASGGAFAIRAMNNYNGGTIKGIVTGGNSGGAVILGQSQSVAIAVTVEASLNGIHIASTTDADDGNCSAIDVSNCYMEQVSTPFVFGLNFSVQGLTGSNNFVGNTLTDVQPVRDAIVKWGRVVNSKWGNNRFAANIAEDIYQIHLLQATGDQFDNELGNDTIGGSFANLFTFQGAFGANTSVQRTVGARNYYRFMDLSTENAVVFQSSTLTANVGFTPAMAFNDFNPLNMGGIIEKVEIFEKAGDCTCTIIIGRTSATSEILSFDPEAETYVAGHSEITPLLTANATVRSDESATFRLLAGAGTGTFRVRITYRVS